MIDVVRQAKLVAEDRWKADRDGHVPQLGIDYWPLDAIAMADPPSFDLHLLMNREAPGAYAETYEVPVRTAAVRCTHGRLWLSWCCAIDAPQERFY